MDFIKKTVAWLIKTSFVLSVIAFAVMYVCSFLWFKMGLSSTQTLFGYAIIDANTKIDIPHINEGDLIIAKEYLYSNVPNVHDVVVYEYNDKFEVSIVEKTSQDENYTTTYKVTPSNTDEPLYIHKDDVIGELLFTADNLGKFGTIAVSPLFIIAIYGFVALIIILFKIYNKKKSSHVELIVDVESNKTTCIVESNNEDVVENNNEVITEEAEVEVNDDVSKEEFISKDSEAEDNEVESNNESDIEEVAVTEEANVEDNNEVVTEEAKVEDNNEVVIEETKVEDNNEVVIEETKVEDNDEIINNDEVTIEESEVEDNYKVVIEEEVLTVETEVVDRDDVEAKVNNEIEDTTSSSIGVLRESRVQPENINGKKKKHKKRKHKKRKK